MKIKIKKLHLEAKVPTRGTEHSAGYDLYAISHKRLDDFTIEYSTGLSFEIPEGHVGLIFPRSSIYKTDMVLTNSVGVIDSDYRGEVKFIFKRPHTRGMMYGNGDRVGQMIILPYPQVEFETGELSETDRGEGGFGSTGK